MDNENEKSKSKVPIWQKSNLTIEEAAEYSGIGRNKLRQLPIMKNVRLYCGLAIRD